MRRIAVVFGILFIYLAMNNFCIAGQWKDLHEQADKVSAETALSMVKENPSSIERLYVLGLVYLKAYKNKEAEDIFNKIISLKPETVEGEWGLAECLVRKHDLEQSSRLLEAIIRKNPGFYPAYLSLAYAKYFQMDFNRCSSLAAQVFSQGLEEIDVSNYVRALCLYAGSKGMIAHYGGALSKIVNGTVVLSTLKKAQKLQPNSAAVLFGLGSFYFLAPVLAGGDMQQAESYLKRAMAEDPLFEDIYVRLAQLYKSQGDNAKYQEYLNKALKIDPHNELALDTASGKCKFICQR